MSKHVERTVTVQKPLSAVWTYLADFTTTTEWDPGTVETERLTGDGGVGTTYRNVSNPTGIKTELTYTVEAYEPEHLITLHGRSDSIETVDTMTFAGDDQQTAVTYRAEFIPKGVAKLAEPLLPLGLKVLGDTTSDSLQEHLEQLPA